MTLRPGRIGQNDYAVCYRRQSGNDQIRPHLTKNDYEFGFSKESVYPTARESIACIPEVAEFT
jgi:hypothetical protein